MLFLFGVLVNVEAQNNRGEQKSNSWEVPLEWFQEALIDLLGCDFYANCCNWKLYIQASLSKRFGVKIFLTYGSARAQSWPDMWNFIIFEKSRKYGHLWALLTIWVIKIKKQVWARWKALEWEILFYQYINRLNNLGYRKKLKFCLWPMIFTSNFTTFKNRQTMTKSI